MPKSNIYGIVLPQELAREARVVAAMEGISRSKLMRDLLENFVKSYPKDGLEIEQQFKEKSDQPS